MCRKSILAPLYTAIVAIIGSSAQAQLRPPELTVTERLEKPIVLQELQIDAEIAGSLALTTVEMLIYNPNGRVLEGSLTFPLLEGQDVVRFAMDGNGKLREAVPVEKAKGQQVFEEVVRRQVDPGLIEKTEGHNYRARVYPIPANGYKRVVLGIFEVLPPAEGGAHFRLPLKYSDILKKFSLKLTVQGPESKPIVLQNTVPGLELPAWREQFTTSVEKADFKADGMIELAVPLAQRPTAFTQRFGDSDYFYSEVRVKPLSEPRSKPAKLGLLWDSSGSGASRAHAREFELLDNYFKALNSVEVELVRLRNTADEPEVFKVSGGDWTALKKALKETAYDGATALGSFTPDDAVNQYILFSDGLNNFSEKQFPELKAPLHTVQSATGGDAAYLRSLAEKSGGEFVNLTLTTPQEGARALQEVRGRVLGLEANPLAAAHLFSRPVAGRPESIAVAGVLRRQSAKVTLRYGMPGGVSQDIEFEAAAGRNESELAARAWAQLKIAALEPNYRENRSDILKTGSDFGIVTRETSLIILDRVEDYLQYNITPPAELKTEFEALQKTELGRREKIASDHLDEVVRLFKGKLDWWNKEFPKDQPKPAKIEAKPRDFDDGFVPLPSAAEPEALLQEGGDAEAYEGTNGRERKQASAETRADFSIQLQKWSPNAPYLDHFRRVPPEDLYKAYLEERPEYLKSTAFFLDAADVFIEKGSRVLALRVLSNLAEMDLQNHQVLRILGYRLMQIGEPGLAIPIFEKVLEIRPEEPQSARDLALACAAAGRYQRAVDLLWEVVSTPWDSRFQEIELIALSELNAIAEAHDGLDLSRVDGRLRKNLPLDLRVILTWDADNTDIDLWVTDPNGEKCMYNHALTYQGGRMSRDFTRGYGPEEFSLRTAKPGKYIVEANYYGNTQQIVAGATTIQLTLSTKFGTPTQRDQSVTLRLKDNKEVVKVGEFEVK